MKRLGHVVLMALVIQLTGMVGLCAPVQAPAEHDCCTPPEQNRPVTPQRTVPQCCLVTAFHERKSIGQTQSVSEDAAPELQPAGRTSLKPELYRPAATWVQRAGHPVSPPLGPLSQSCILLI